MCLTAGALALFLNLLDPALISTEDGRITIDAAVAPTVWLRDGEAWCVVGS